MKRLFALLIILIPLVVSAQTVHIKGLYNGQNGIKLLYSNNTYDFINKGLVARVVFFASSPTALNIEMLKYGGNTNDATYRINTNQLIAPSNVPTGKALADTLANWLTFFSSSSPYPLRKAPDYSKQYFGVTASIKGFKLNTINHSNKQI